MQITCDGGLTFCIYTGRLFVRVADCWRLSELVYFSSSYSREMNGSHSPPPCLQTTSRSGYDVFVWNIICVHVFPPPPDHFISANGVFAESFCLLGVITVKAWGIISIDKNESGCKNIMLFFTLVKWQKASRKYFTITSCDQLKRG